MESKPEEAAEQGGTVLCGWWTGEMGVSGMGDSVEPAQTVSADGVSLLGTTTT